MTRKKTWSDWAADWGLQHHPRGNLYERVSGFRNGYPIRITRTGFDSTGIGGHYGTAVTIGYPSADASAMDAFAQDPLLKELPGWQPMHDGPGKLRDLELGDRMLTWRPHLSLFREPKPADVAPMVDTLLLALSRHIPSYAGRCDDCGGESVSILFCDGIPLPFCENCRTRRLQQQLEIARAEQDFQLKADPPQPRPLHGLFAGLVAMIVAIGSWWQFSGRAGSVHGLVALLTTAIVAGTSIVHWKVLTGAALASAGLLSVATVATGAIVAMWRRHVPPNLAWEKIWERPGSAVGLLAMALVGCFLGLYSAAETLASDYKSTLPNIQEP